MNRQISFAIGVAALLAATVTAAQAQATEGGATDTDTRSFQVIGNVPVICAGGTLTGGDSTFALGVLVDTSTGLLRNDLSAPPKILSGAFCSGRSTIEIAASRLTAQNSTTTPPPGFSNAVDFTATAAGWTTTPASVATDATTNPNAIQSRATAFSGDIAVSLANFTTTGGNTLRPIADTSYLGSVIVTLTAAN